VFCRFSVTRSICRSACSWRDEIGRVFSHAHHLAAYCSTPASTYKCPTLNPSSKCTPPTPNNNTNILYHKPLPRRYHDIVTPSRHGKFSCVPPRDVRMVQRVARLLSWRLNTILSNVTGIFGSLSFRMITRLAKSLSLIASQTNPDLDCTKHEERTLFDSMSGDLADSISSILPR
jgi:hypothetical protein